MSSSKIKTFNQAFEQVLAARDQPKPKPRAKSEHELEGARRRDKKYRAKKQATAAQRKWNQGV